MSRFRVMTYNVRYFGHSTRGVASTRGGIRQIAETLAGMSPLVDVVCLQEVEQHSLRSSLVTWRPKAMTRPHQLDVMMKALNQALHRRGILEHYGAHYFPAHTYRLTKNTNLYTTGLAILVRSRHEVIDHNLKRKADITHRRGAKALKQTRICAHVSVRAARGGMLDVFNTHMSLPGPFYPEFWQGGERFGYGPNQLVEARRVLETMDACRTTDNTVLMGDFNSLPGSPVDRLLREEGGLVDALAMTTGLGDEKLKAWATAGFMQKRMNIDRIYASPSLEWIDFDGTRSFDEHRTEARALRTFGGLSDHIPLVGTLKLS